MFDFYKNLSASEWAALIPFGVACAAVGFGVKNVVDKKLYGVNPGIKKGEAKVVDCFDIEDLGKQAAFCRCWRSSKFPYCDGTHSKYNAVSGDNVGPLVLSKKQ